ncbi:uncharacterized protein LOC116351224 [Contarinia nasturtii]|uniref:uncharacterized protein LOC116351224 n=1 Tax=Contarinia nasturtii TaxID=265458 RepID=UPI0012D43680|nr:uncharacterized protein LOC116351224 [Contarinia nasturtii]
MRSEAQLKFEIELYKKGDEINKLTEKCEDQQKIKAALGCRIADLEELEKYYKKQIVLLQNQLHRSMNTTNINDVNTKELINCLMHGVMKSEKFPAYVREVAINMHYHSPRAYEFLRKTFNNNLPHTSTLRRWYAHSDLNTGPGITTKTLEFLKKKGYVTYGCDDKDDPLIAKEAIVFVVSGLNEKFRIPAAYHFVNSLDAIKKAALVNLVLVALTETGVTIASLTFDGHPTN